MTELWEILQLVLFDYTLRTVAIGTAILGVVSGALGAFAVLRRQSLLGDAMSHAALPGVVLAFMLTGDKSPAVLMAGAAIAGLIGTLLLVAITNTTRIKEDSGLGIILSVFFGFGLMLLTFLQQTPSARQAGLTTFLFGQAATLLERDVIVMGAVGIVVLMLVIIFWKEFKLLSFDRDFGASLGYPVLILEIFLTTLLVIAIVIGLQAVGVVLMSAMVVAPAAAARQWTNHMGRMVILSALIGAFSGVTGAIISSTGSGLSTGPVIVLVVSSIVLVSLAIAPNRGLIWNWAKNKVNQRRLNTDRVLQNLYLLGLQHDNPTHPHMVGALRVMQTPAGLRKSLSQLETKGFVKQAGREQWQLTNSGVEHAKTLVDPNAMLSIKGTQHDHHTN